MNTTQTQQIKKLRVGIAGSAGYTGGELIRILLRHPFAEIVFAHSTSQAGKPVAAIHEDLVGETELAFSSDMQQDIDVLFLCVGHGEAKKFLASSQVNENVAVIDLSQDFRLLENHPVINGKNVLYGLPELHREAIKKASHIANPGCFATAIQLGLLPLAKAGLLGTVYTTGITGSTGAGQSLSPTSHFSWRANNIQAYKSLTHQHIAEIHQSIQQLQHGFGHDGAGVQFVPWRGDFTRGIFVSSQLECSESLDKLYAMYDAFYTEHPFTVVSRNAIHLKQVVNTNKCIIQLEKNGNHLVVHSVIDNLVKGASGQAVQNMNLMFGIDECAGLHLKGVAF